MIYEDFWGSIVAFANDIIDERKTDDPTRRIGYIDWEAHANIQELPDHDLVGTTAVTLTEEEAELFSGSFTIGVSTCMDDKSLFRLRNYVGAAFAKMRPGMKIPFYDSKTLAHRGWMEIVDGTVVMPMTRADVRPLQFVQCHLVFEAVTAGVAG